MKDPVFGKYARLVDEGNDCSKYILYTIGDTSTAAMKDLTFEYGLYTAHFTCTSTDGKKFEKLHYIIFKK